MQVAKEYVLYDKNDQVVMLGTIKQISDYLNRYQSSVRASMSRIKNKKCKRMHGGYIIYPVEGFVYKEPLKIELLKQENEDVHTEVYNNTYSFTDTTIYGLTKTELKEYIRDIQRKWCQVDKEYVKIRRELARTKEELKMLKRKVA